MGTSDRIHRATSDDGTEIAGRVLGEGPPLVLVHGSMEDGEFMWSALLPFLRDRFTCYLMSTRSRGLSGASGDLSPERLVQDVAAFAKSIGGPVGLMGESAGGMLALGAAARTDAVSAVAAYEPTVFEVFGEDNAKLLEKTLGVVGALAAEGRMADAARAFAEPLVTEDEMGAVVAAGHFEEGARYVPVLLQELQQANESQGQSPTDPEVLARITEPVLLMHGSESALRSWFTEGVRYVSEHVPDARSRQIPGAGHWAPVLHPEPIAAELVQFFGESLQAA